MACLIWGCLLFSCNNQLIPIQPVVTKGLADKLGVGKSAHDLLSNRTYQRLNIEIQFAPGMRPHEKTVNNLLSFIRNFVQKPGGITVTLKQVGSIGKPKINTQDADSFALKNRVLYTTGDLICLYIYFADAASVRFWVGGVAYRNTAMVVFEKTILENTRGSGTETRVITETGVLEHEMGHLLGLVNSGTPQLTHHEDGAHANHCSNPKCLMYHAIEGGWVKHKDLILPLLDANCIRDLKAYRDQD